MICKIEGIVIDAVKVRTVSEKLKISTVTVRAEDAINRTQVFEIQYFNNWCKDQLARVADGCRVVASVELQGKTVQTKSGGTMNILSLRGQSLEILQSAKSLEERLSEHAEQIAGNTVETIDELPF